MSAQGPINLAKQTAGTLPEPDDILVPFLRDAPSETISSRDERRESHTGSPRSLQDNLRGDVATLHELANSITAVLIQAQVLEWKLPPYSRLKRPAREIERHAQRSGALLKRLLRQWEANPAEEASQELCKPVSSLRGTMAAVAARGPEATAQGQEKLPPVTPAVVDPPFSLSSRNRTHKVV